MTSGNNNFNNFPEYQLTKFRRTAHLSSLQIATRKKPIPLTFSRKHLASTRQQSGGPVVGLVYYFLSEFIINQQFEVSPNTIAAFSPMVDFWVFVACLKFPVQGPDLQNILRQSYDHPMPQLRSTNYALGLRLIYKASYEVREAFLGYDSLAKS